MWGGAAIKNPRENQKNQKNQRRKSKTIKNHCEKPKTPKNQKNQTMPQGGPARWRSPGGMVWFFWFFCFFWFFWFFPMVFDGFGIVPLVFLVFLVFPQVLGIARPRPLSGQGWPKKPITVTVVRPYIYIERERATAPEGPICLCDHDAVLNGVVAQTDTRVQNHNNGARKRASARLWCVFERR